MFESAVFQCRGTDAGGGAGDDVVRAAEEAHESLIGHRSSVSRDQPIAAVFLPGGFLIVPIAKKHDGVWRANGDMSFVSEGQSIAFIVYDSDLVSWPRLA